MMGRNFWLGTLGSILLFFSGAVIASSTDGLLHIVIGLFGVIAGGIVSGHVASAADKADRAEGGEDEDE